MQLIETVRTGQGLYTPQEAAAYARMPVTSLNYWLYGNKTHAALRNTLIANTEGRYLTFIEFMEAVAIRSFRVNHGISLPKIRQAIEEAKTKYGVDYPFANKKHRTYAIGKDLHIVLEGDADPLQITGKQTGQTGMKVCLEQFMHDFVWDEQDALIAYRAHRHVTESNRVIDIMMRPNTCFGAPVVGDTGYTAETLWRAANAEGDFKKAAGYYGVDVEDVIAAYRYCQEIELAAA
jgi:uncharacterized protein (DUF433 family)